MESSPRIVTVAVSTPVLRPAAAAREEEDDDEEEEEELDDLLFQDENEVYARSKFFESWLWQDVKLPATVDRDG